MNQKIYIYQALLNFFVDAFLVCTPLYIWGLLVLLLRLEAWLLAPVARNSVSSGHNSWNLMRGFLPVVFLLSLIIALVFRQRFIDYFLYWRQGETYLQTVECIVTQQSGSGIYSSLILNSQDIQCDNGARFRIRLRAYQSFKGRFVRIVFLPRSHMALRVDMLK